MSGAQWQRRALDNLKLGLRMVGNCSVGARNQNPVLCKITKCSLSAEPGVREMESVAHSTGSICTSTSRGSNALFWPPQAPGKHTTHRYTCRQNMHIHQIKIIKQIKTAKPIWPTPETCILLIRYPGVSYVLENFYCNQVWL